MIILAIETSCDETACAVIEGTSSTLPVRVLTNVIASSEEMHKKIGGIIPEVAAREQLRSIIPVVDAAIENGKLKMENLDAMAVTVGPGLIGSLLVGVETARALAYAWEKPIIPVNHLLAHLYANFVREKRLPEFPAIGLVVSGGHTELVLMEDYGKLKLLGRTRDDAAGECFDKGARLLGLGYPGGPAIAKASQQFRNPKSEIKLPRPLIQENTYDFSFSGLKTALAREVAQVAKVEQVVQELAYELQEAIVEVLVERVMRAIKEFRPKSVLLGGGVASNNRLRQLLKFEIRNTKSETKLFIPSPELCTDNAAMIGAAAYFNYKPVPWEEVRVDPGLEVAI